MSGFDGGVFCFFFWLGVSYYLMCLVIEVVFDFVVGFVLGSEIVFDFWLEDIFVVFGDFIFLCGV